MQTTDEGMFERRVVLQDFVVNALDLLTWQEVIM